MEIRRFFEGGFCVPDEQHLNQLKANGFNDHFFEKIVDEKMDFYAQDFFPMHRYNTSILLQQMTSKTFGITYHFCVSLQV